MRYLSIILLFFFAFQASITAQDSIPKDVLESIQSEDLKQIVYKLSSFEMEGRGLNTQGIKKAGEFIYKHFESDGIGYIPALNGYQQDFNVKIIKLAKPLVNFGDLQCSEFSDYVGSVSTMVNKNGYDLVLLTNPSIDIVNGLDLDNKVLLILTSDIFFPKKEFYEILIQKGCCGVVLCNPNDKKEFSKMSKIYSLKEGNKKDKLKIAFSGSLQKTDSLFKNLRYKDFYQSTIVLKPKFAAKILGLSQKELAYQFSSNRLNTAYYNRKGLRVKVAREIIRSDDAGFNVLGFIKGEGNGKEAVVISAHYDHLGIESSSIMFGADDNASGVAALMEIAEAYSRAQEKGFRPKRSIIFAAFSGEEKGLWGSRAFVKSCDSLKVKPIVNFNLDMIGRGEDSHWEKERAIKKVYAIAHRRDSLLCKQIKLSALYSDSLFVDYSSADIYSSDQASFIIKGIPGVMFFRGLHNDYHTERDTPDKLDYQTMERIARLVFKVSWVYVQQ